MYRCYNKNFIWTTRNRFHRHDMIVIGGHNNINVTVNWFLRTKKQQQFPTTLNHMLLLSSTTKVKKTPTPVKPKKVVAVRKKKESINVVMNDTIIKNQIQDDTKKISKGKSNITTTKDKVLLMNESQKSVNVSLNNNNNQSDINNNMKEIQQKMNWLDIMKDHNNNNASTSDTMLNAKKRDKRISKEVSDLFDSIVVETPKDLNKTLISSSNNNDHMIQQHDDQHNKSNNNISASFQEYLNIMNAVIESDKFQKKHAAKPISSDVMASVAAWLRSPKPFLDCKNNLLTFQSAMHNHSNNNATTTENNNNANQKQKIQITKNNNDKSFELFRHEIDVQQNALQQYMMKTFDIHNFQIRLAITALCQASNMCAKNMNGIPISYIWEKFKEIGCTDQGTIQTLLYTSTTCMIMKPSSSRRRRKSSNNNYHQLMGNMESILELLDDADSSQHNNDDVDIDYHEKDNFIDITDEIAIYHDLLYQPTEQTISIRIRLLVSQGNAIEAEELLLSTMNHINNKQSDNNNITTQEDFKLRLRSFQPVLRLHIQQNNIISALSLYRTMQTISTVLIDVETYIHLLIGLAERLMFICHNSNNNNLPGLHELNFVPPGPKLFDQFVDEMSQKIIHIPENATRMLRDAFMKGYQQQSLQKLSPNNNIPNEFIANRVYIDPTVGICPKTNIKLRLIELTIQQKEQLKNSIVKLANDEQKKYQSNMISKNKNNRKSTTTNTNTMGADEQLLKFYNWLNQRNDGLPYTAIIDGANVGYYMQNYHNGGFSYHQIQFVLQTLERMGETPLIILPRKYTHDSFYNTVTVGDPIIHNNNNNGSTQQQSTSSRPKQHLTIAEKKIRDNLLNSGKLFIVPPGHLDDYYWILASVSDQSKSRNRLGSNASLNVQAGDVNGRWPGTRPVLITNDQMRDHKVEMLEPMLFRRWRSNYIVNFSFAAFIDGVCTTNPEIGFAQADFYSREIQGNQYNDNNDDSMVWHFPIDEHEDEWFCVHLPSTNM